jgi:shikimate kinase
MGGNIFLVGMMGAGKTTVGKALAHRAGLEFVDTDRVLVERCGVPVATIFEIEGEDGFRKRESDVLVELGERDSCVVATGGGAVLAPENRQVMRDSGTVIYLRARVDSLWERVRHDASRPLLQKRDPLYREAAHLIVETGAQSASTLVGRVLVALRQHANTARSRP